MNKRQKRILNGRRPTRRIASVKPVDERFGPNPLRLMYHWDSMDVVISQATYRLHEWYMEVMTEHILSGFGVPANQLEVK